MPRRPNLILAVLDTTRADEALALDRLPGLRGLALEGTVFRRAISPAPWTLPAHGSLFSGLLPHEHLLTGDLAIPGGRLRPVTGRIEELAERWLPARLRKAGYQTLAVSANPWITVRMGWGLGFDRYEESWRAMRNPRFHVEGTGRRAPWRRHVPGAARKAVKAIRRTVRTLRATEDSGAAQALVAFRRWMGSLDKDRPYFAFFNFMEAHAPYRPPRPHGPGGRARLAAARVGGKLSNEFVVRYNVGRAELPRDDLDLLRSLYRGEVAYLDSRLAELTAIVRESRGETLVAVVGDHGENLGEKHLLGHQTSVADTLLRVPLILSGPQDLAGRGEVAEPVSTARVAATLLRVASLEPRDPTLFDRSPDDAALSWYESAYSEAAGARALADGELADDPSARAALYLRAWTAHRGPHKLVVRSDGTKSLFDVNKDPGETRDLATSHPELVAEFDGLALPLEPATGPPAAEAGREELAEIEAHLQSLGYL